MNSILNKTFGFNPLVHKKSKEITAGITTFLIGIPMGITQWRGFVS